MFMFIYSFLWVLTFYKKEVLNISGQIQEYLSSNYNRFLKNAFQN